LWISGTTLALYETQDTLANLISTTRCQQPDHVPYISTIRCSWQFPLLSVSTTTCPTIFAPQNNTRKYEKAGTLNLNRVFFIVTGTTASASELLINTCARTWM
jgi:hypothetical protein